MLLGCVKHPSSGRNLVRRLRMPIVTQGWKPYLTRRERDVLELAAEGLKNNEIAERLDLDTSSVASYFTRIYEHLNIRQARAQAIWVYLRGWRDAE